MYTRAISTLGCADKSLDDALALCAQHRLPGIELRALAGTLDLPAHFAAVHGSPAALARRLADSPTCVVALDTSVRLIGGPASDRTQLLAFAPWADALGVPWLRVFDGGPALDAAARAAAAETMTWWQATRRERGFRVNLMVETHDELLDAARIEAFAAALPDGRLPLLWDSHHTWRKGGEDPEHTWSRIRGHVVHVHVKDSVAEPNGTHQFRYVLPGTGDFPMHRLRPVLAAAYAGAVCLEWERLWHPALPTLDEALRSAAELAWW